MKKDTYKTDVIFRKYKDGGAILALFPYSVGDRNGNVECYEHIGQHGTGDYEHCVNTLTIPATEAEAKDLKVELESIGYDLVVKKKRNATKYFDSFDELRKRLG